MRINQYLALASGISRRSADQLVKANRVKINQHFAEIGQVVTADDIVLIDDNPVKLKDKLTTIMLNKPVGYVCSRKGQGSQTIYNLVPTEYHHLKPVGRLDKDSSGLLLLTDDGQLANQLTHPSFFKQKIYEVTLDKPLDKNSQEQIQKGIPLDDGISKLELAGDAKNWTITMHEGRNRQIRRTFAALGYDVLRLNRTHFGPYALQGLKSGDYTIIQ